MTNILEEIYQHKLIEVRNKKKVVNLTEICAKGWIIFSGI